MATINFNSTGTASALQSMSSAASGMQSSAKDYMSTVENDVFANLSGSVVQGFVNQIETHCNNLANIAKDLKQITDTLSQIAAHHADKDSIISRQ